MTRKLRVRATVLVAIVGLVACELTEPVDVAPRPSIVIQLPPESDSIFGLLNEAHFYITPPAGMTRDTLLRFEPNPASQRVRIQLRPDETVSGTVIDLELKDFGVVLFTGRLELPRGEDWELSLLVPVEPVLDMVVSAVLVVSRGSTRTLSDLAWVSYANGSIAPDETIAWSVTNPAAAVISDGRVTFPIPGSVGLIARWRDQQDTVSVSIRR